MNHCGDNSDETGYASCIDETSSSQILGLGVSLFVTLTLVVLMSCLVLCVGVLCLCQRMRLGTPGLLPGGGVASAALQAQGNNGAAAFPSHQPGSGGVYGGTAERLCEKPPPYPGNNYPPASGIGFHVPQESLYYPATK